jgi:hypothetical protein
MTVLEALRDPHLFGCLPDFHDPSTWERWRVFIAAVYGLPLFADELLLFQKHTGRTVPRPGGYPESVMVVGRQSGKTRIAAALAVWEAACAEDARGQCALLVAQDERSALRTLFGYVKEAFEGVPMLAGSVAAATRRTIELSNRVTLAAYPCRPQSVRGLRARIAVVDELAFFMSSEGYPTDVEMLRALRPTLAMTSGRLIVLSSPYGASGALHDLYRRHFGKNDSPTLVWQASSAEMNPCLPCDYLARMAEDDPEAYRSEFLGEFRAGAATLFDPEVLDGCIVPGRRELLPVGGTRYAAFADPSGGRDDAFAIAVAHRDGDRIVVDCLRAWLPKFDPSSVVAEGAALLKRYRCDTVTGDRYAGEWPREAFRSHRIEYRFAEMDRSRLYLELLPMINAGTVELPDDDKLLRELRGLERRRGSAGRDRVNHPPKQHDDLANCVAGVVSELAYTSDEALMIVPPIVIPKQDAGMPYAWEPWPRI